MNKKLFLRTCIFFVFIILFFGMVSAIFEEDNSIIGNNKGDFNYHLKDNFLVGDADILEDKVDSEGLQQSDFKGYIIEFEEEPILVKKVELEKKAEENEKFIEEHPILSTVSTFKFWAIDSESVPGKVQNYQKDLGQNHQGVKENILNTLFEQRRNKVASEYKNSEGTIKVLGEYKSVLNGIALDISVQEAKEVENVDGVKRVSPNYEINMMLDESVPLIQDGILAGQLDEDGNDCLSSGKQCLTGEGITIGIIDTGIDYTHEDLGGSVIDEQRVYEKITASRDSSYPFITTQQISIDNNRLAYTSKDKVKIYYFNTHETTEIELFSPGLDVIRLSLEGDILTYYASNPSLNIIGDASIYYYNLDTREHKVIESNIASVNNLFSSEGKVVYTKTINSESNIYVYNTITGEKNVITEDSIYQYYPAVSNNFVAYAIDSGNCFEKVVIYNMDTKESEDLLIENVGPILAFEDKKIIYNDCDINNYDPNWKVISLYDLETNERTVLRNFEGNIGAKSLIFSTPSAAIGDGIFYFSKSGFNGNIVAYDIKLNRFVEINPFTVSGDIAAEGNRICFISNDMNIYCHDYNPDNDYTLPNLNLFNSKVIGGYDFFNNDDDPMDDQGHGTHCAGIAAGNGVLKGVAPDAELYAYKVCDSNGCPWSAIISAIERSVDPNSDGNYEDKLDVISLSFGGPGNPDDVISQAIDNVVDVGVVAVIAAGNSGPSEQTIGSPGTARKAITVGAIDKQNNIAGFSSRGPVFWNDEDGNKKIIIKPDVVAPGVDICSTQYGSAWQDSQCLDNEHTAISGTSMATPHVAGAVAILKQKNPSWTPEEIKSALKSTAVDLGENIITQGAGKINLKEAVKLNFPLEMSWDFYVYVDSKINNIYDKIEIKGIFPEDYDSLNVEWKKEGEGNLKTSGIKIVGENSIVAEFNPEGIISETGDYQFRVKINKNSVEKESVAEIYFDKDLKKGWPIREDTVSDKSNPIIVDLDNNGKQEIIFGAFGTPKIYVYNYDGTSFLNWPVSAGSYSLSPSVGDIGGDGVEEIVASSNDGGIYIFDISGKIINNWNVGFPISEITTPSLGDVNNDGQLEIVVSLRDKSSDFVSWIYVWDHNGRLLDGWPVKLGDESSLHPYLNPSIGDINNDGYLDIIVTSLNFNNPSKVYAFNYDGLLLNGWPVTVTESDTGFDFSPSLGDINNNRYLEVVGNGRNGGQSKIFVWDYNGRLLNGWPKDNSGWSSISLGNINSDEDIEIISGTSVFSSKGLLIQEYKDSISGDLYGNRFSPIIADLNTDKKSDFINIYNKRLYAWDSDGNLIGDLHKTSYPVDSASAISDLDDNGKFDFVAIDSGNFIYVWELDAPYNPDSMDWPMFQHDPQHTGCYDCEELSPTTKPNSQLSNNGDSDIQGILKINIFKLVKEDEWEERGEVLYQENVILPAGGSIDLGEIFNSKEFSLPAQGKYKIYASFNTKSGESVETEWEFEVIE